MEREGIHILIIKQKITDNTSGFRAYNKRAIKFLAFNYPQDYPEPENVIMMGKNGFKILEVFTPRTVNDTALLNYFMALK